MYLNRHVKHNSVFVLYLCSLVTFSDVVRLEFRFRTFSLLPVADGGCRTVVLALALSIVSHRHVPVENKGK